MRFPLLTFCGSWSTARRYSWLGARGGVYLIVHFGIRRSFIALQGVLGEVMRRSVGLTVNVTGGLIGVFGRRLRFDLFSFRRVLAPAFFFGSERGAT